MAPKVGLQQKVAISKDSYNTAKATANFLQRQQENLQNRIASYYNKNGATDKTAQGELNKNQDLLRYATKARDLADFDNNTQNRMSMNESLAQTRLCYKC